MVLGDSGDPHRAENHCSRTISEIIIIHMNLRLGTWISVATILALCVHQDFLISHIEGKYYRYSKHCRPPPLWS